MQKPISTRMHGMLDLVTAGTLCALPRAMGWSDRVTRLMTTAGLGALGYSMLTRYEMGLIKVLPMKVHLGLDALSGAMLCAAPAMLDDEDPEVKGALIGLGLFEIAAALSTRTEPAAVSHEWRPSQVGSSMPREAQHGDGRSSSRIISA